MFLALDLGRARRLGADDLLEIVRHVAGASGRFRRKGKRKRHERADAAYHDPKGAHDRPPLRSYGFGHAAPVCTQASTSAPACFLRAGRGLPPGAGRPRPADQMILADMFHEGLQRPVAVAGGILDLGADLAERLAFPAHFARREMPDRVSGHRAEVRRLMTDRTAQRRQAEAVGAAFDRRLMQPRHVALARAVAGRMAIETARVGQHFAELGEIGGRPRLLIADRRKALDAGEAVWRGVRNRLGGQRGRRESPRRR